MNEIMIKDAAVVLEDSAFRVVTADQRSARDQIPIRAFLSRVRHAFGMDVVFVSRFADGHRIIRFTDADLDDEYAVPEGASDPFEESYCHHIVEGRLPQVIRDTNDVPLALAITGTRICRVGSHLGVPIVASDGSVYGTVCCFSHAPKRSLGEREELEALREIAVLLADVLLDDERG
ncbi:GAF domain-containing protein [Ramlibacter humi]|uniref:GAF domain-containing protein n=1 Tax=Ramlibacter humi TaxID=2530451 RepID=A0A4Z0BYE4_9BURK|nr:GAF domain-containing protein [Ramlibacter humi]TFZ03534.1 GAF domain-containing protein [Ramlibacter humi]